MLEYLERYENVTKKVNNILNTSHMREMEHIRLEQIPNMGLNYSFWHTHNTKRCED